MTKKVIQRCQRVKNFEAQIEIDFSLEKYTHFTLPKIPESYMSPSSKARIETPLDCLLLMSQSKYILCPKKLHRAELKT